MKIEIHNHGCQVRQQESRRPNGERQLKIWLEAMFNVRLPGQSTDRITGGQYGLSPRVTRRRNAVLTNYATLSGIIAKSVPMADTTIEWTDATWNPVAGCAIVTAGCTNCYAMRMAARLEAMGVEKYKGLTRKTGGRAKWTGKIHFDEAALAIPASWRQPRKVFVNSMSDLFHPDVPLEFIGRVWSVMEECDRHVFQILTKRPERMAEVLGNFRTLPNVWLGTSVENNAVVARIDDLRRVPAAIRFVSLEPLIGSVDNADLTDIHWAIVGGESGPKARPMDPAWVDEIKDLCDEAGTAFFFKQWGGVNKKQTGRFYRGRTWDQFPATIAV